jgi:hypothetical protein
MMVAAPDIAVAWHGLKVALVAATGQSNALLHVHVGLAAYVGFQLVMGTRRGALPALLLVVQLELANEVLDYAYFHSWRLADTAQDAALTLLWPTILTTTSHFRRWRWDRLRDRHRAATDLVRTLTRRSAADEVPRGKVVSLRAFALHRTGHTAPPE